MARDGDREHGLVARGILEHATVRTAPNEEFQFTARNGPDCEYFVEQGYVVYMIDQAMRGRSAWHPGDGATCSAHWPSGSGA